jgi:CRP-like cAMP-binding protein
MDELRSQIVFHLSRMAVFKGLAPGQIELIADSSSLVTLSKGETLFSEGDEGENFFILFSGKVRLFIERDEQEITTAVLFPGDYFGEEALLENRPRSVTAVALKPTQVISLSNDFFYQLVEQHRTLRRRLILTLRSRQLARRRGVEWLGEEETIHWFTRKDIAILFLSLIPPLIAIWVGGGLTYLASTTALGAFTIIGEWVGLIILVIGLLWGVWDFIDWTNDYYLVTNQRVIALEKIILLYESRQEAPMDTVLTVGLNTGLIGRILNFGDVRVKTFTGQIDMRHVGHPEYMVALIEEFINRVKLTTRYTETEELERAIRYRLGLPLGDDPEPAHTRLSMQPPPAQRGENPFRFLLDIFKIRVEENGIVTYRRHWLVLLKRAWLPTFAVVALAGVFVAWLINGLPYIPSSIFLLFWIFLFIGVLIWWIYEYVDWRNDIYQVTEEHIVDVYKKPLGEIDKKTAPLENILSLHHEQTGIIRLILNYGDVVAMVGHARFTFDGVYNPSEVVQDIFLRMNARKRRQREVEASRERERVADWLAAYHRQLETLRRLENSNNSDQNSV